MPLEQDKFNGWKLKLREEIPTGLFPELFAHSIPLWKVGQNIQFTHVGVEKLPGWTVLKDPGNGEPIRGLMQNVETSGAAAIIYAGDLTQLYRYDVTNDSLETLGTGYNLSEDSGYSEWDSGSTTWDSGTTLWDEGIIKASHWSIINYGDYVLATSGADNPQIKTDTGVFTDMADSINLVTIASGGTGYTLGDTLTLTGGAGTGATIEVTQVGGSGEIEAVKITAGGSGWTTAGSSGFTGGTGSGGSISGTCMDLYTTGISTVQIWVKRGPHILGFSTNVSDKEFIWCDADDPFTWATGPDNLAGQLQIRELKGPIRAAVPLGEYIAVYGDDQMFLVNYLANDLVFGYSPVLDGVGAVSKKAVVAIDRLNYGLSQQGFFRTDGASFEYIDEPAIREWFDNNSASAQLGKAIAFHDEENTQVRWYLPTSSSAITGGVSFNYKTNTWSIIESAKSAGQERIILGGPITGGEDGILYREVSGLNDGVSAMTSWVRSKPLDWSNADIVKELDSIRIGFTGTGLQYRIGWSEEENGTINWGSYTDMDQGFPFHNLRTAGRWLHFEIYSATTNADWLVASVEFIGRMEGTR